MTIIRQFLKTQTAELSGEEEHCDVDITAPIWGFVEFLIYAPDLLDTEFGALRTGIQLTRSDYSLL
jgi:hypothetical protein